MQQVSKRVLFAGAAMALTLATSTTFGSPVAVRVPIVCSRGPSGQTFNVGVTMPASQATGTTFAIRIDAAPSGKISHTGLNYIFDMQTDYVVPAGTAYVEGSARILAGTGTANVRASARVWHDAEGIHLALPARVENGSGYTPPSIELQVEVRAPAGTSLSLKLARHKVAASVFLLGTLRTTCDPNPRPSTIGTTLVSAPPPAAVTSDD